MAKATAINLLFVVNKNDERKRRDALWLCVMSELKVYAHDGRLSRRGRHTGQCERVHNLSHFTRFFWRISC